MAPDAMKAVLYPVGFSSSSELIALNIKCVLSQSKVRAFTRTFAQPASIKSAAIDIEDFL